MIRGRAVNSIKAWFHRSWLRIRAIEPLKQRALIQQYRTQQTKQYWYRRRRWHQIQFRFANWVYRLQRVWHSWQEVAVVLHALLRAILPQVLFALFLVIGADILELMLHSWSTLPVWLGPLAWSFQSSKDAYGALATSLIELTGAFLALYFTAVTVVASTVYSEVPDDVRQLLIKEKFGNVYFRTIALLGAIAVLIAAALAVDYVPGVINLALVTIIAVFSIFSFIVLGLNTLNFFNPTSLLRSLDRDFIRWAEAATPAGVRWRDKSFQTHYQQQAERALQTYRNTIRLVTAKSGMGPRPVSITVQHSLGLLIAYGGIKSHIPTESNWFRRTGEFQNWLMTDPSRVMIALSTGTGIEQKVVPDLLWVENDLQAVIRQGLEKFVKSQDWQQVVALLNQWQSTMGLLSGLWDSAEADRLFNSLGDLIREQIIQTDEQALATSDDYYVLGMRLAALDLYQLGFIQIVLGFTNRLASLAIQDVGSWIRSNLELQG